MIPFVDVDQIVFIYLFILIDLNNWLDLNILHKKKHLR